MGWFDSVRCAGSHVAKLGRKSGVAPDRHGDLVQRVEYELLRLRARGLPHDLSLLVRRAQVIHLAANILLGPARGADLDVPG